MKEKQVLQSKTIWAAAIGGIATLLQVLNIVTITPEDQNTITMGILAMIQLAGAIGAIYGRIKANTKIK